MIKHCTSLCIIPARGGSKGLKHKNIRLCNGRPLLYWVLEAARQSTVHDRIVVSTDDKKIAKVAKDLGAEVQMRPEHLAKDEVPVTQILPYVIRHMGQEYDYTQILEPTGPLVEARDIRNAARRLFNNPDKDMIISVCPASAPLGFAAPIDDENNIRNWFPTHLRHKNRQDVGPVWQLDGNIYIAKTKVFDEQIDYWDTNIMAFKMPANKYVDIDDELDLRVAGMCLEERYANQSLLSRIFGNK